MSKSDYVAPFTMGVAFAAVTGAIVAVSGGGISEVVTIAGTTSGTAVAVFAKDIKTGAMLIAGGLTGVAAAAFTAHHFETTPPESPAPTVTEPVTTLVVEGDCRRLETKIIDKDGRRAEVILPQGCILQPN